ncbi:hypothetical protein BDZ45DRAFT_737301 [Acephala macrosclerotiorum]|nr:hypothetical protein BDZ45DRAFT_737301 [Acephala macrosclerotiorum]
MTYADSDSKDYEALLYDDESLGESTVPSIRERPRSWILIHSLVLLSYSLLFAFLVYRQTSTENCPYSPALIHSPANEALKPEKILFDDDIAKWNPYRGEPRPEMDEAWHELLKYSNIRVSAEDLKAIDRTSVRLSDGSGMYMSELNVYHQLHCLKMIRQSMHLDKYDMPMAHMSEHIDHCLDNLRLLVMCKADVSLQTYDWLDNTPRPFANFKIEHECYNWDSVNEWAKARSFDLYDNVTLIHPTLGPSFPVDETGTLIEIETGDSFLGKIITPPVE